MGEENYLIICRHAQGEHNLREIFNSDPSHPEYFPVSLTPFGKTQAEKLGQEIKSKVKGMGIGKVFVSDLPRTQETFEAMGFSSSLGIPLQKDSRLNEVKKGNFEGKSMASFPYHNWDNRYGRDYGGEIEEDVMVRVESFIQEKLLNSLPQILQENKSYVIITHGTVAKNFLERLWGAPIQLHLAQGAFIPLKKLEKYWHSYPENKKIQEKIPLNIHYSHGLSFYSYEYFEEMAREFIED